LSRDRLDGDQHAGNVGAEAGHRAGRFRAGEELRVGLVHFPIEIGPRQQHGDLHHAIERRAGSLEDGLDVAQALAGLLGHGGAGDFGLIAARHCDLARDEHEAVGDDGIRIRRMRRRIIRHLDMADRGHGVRA
jgi:hypothetical protein